MIKRRLVCDVRAEGSGRIHVSTRLVIKEKVGSIAHACAAHVIDSAKC